MAPAAETAEAGDATIHPPMPTTKPPPGVPDESRTSMTSQTHDQLIMTSDRTRGGFRLLYPSEDSEIGGHATLSYCIERPSHGYDHIVMTADLTRKVSFDTFRSEICPRSQKIDPPKKWADAAWEAWTQGRAPAVQKVLRKIDARRFGHPDGQPREEGR